MVTPALRTWSMNRRKPSTSKKNWVIARVAPASILAFSTSMSWLDAGALRMHVRIEADADLEVADRPDAGGQFGGVGVAVGARRVGAADLARRIAAQGHDVADAGVPVVAGSPRPPRRGEASTQVRCAAGFSVGLFEHAAAPCGACARGWSRRRRRSPRRTSGSAAPAGGSPPTGSLPPPAVFGGENSKETLRPAALADAGAGDGSEGACEHRQRALMRRSSRGSAARTAVQILTVRPPARAGGSVSASPRPGRRRPASAPISSSEKPRRRCWCCSRRNSSSCGAKSTMISRPPGATSRAASATAAAGSPR